MCSRLHAALICAISGGLLCVSCGIKEDRSACSCRLVLDMDGARAFPELLLTLENDDGKQAWTLYPPKGDAVLEISRTRYRRIACDPSSYRFDSEEGWIIAEGEDCPEIYLGVKSLDARYDSITDTIILHKQFAVLDIEMNVASDEDAEVTVEGSICGCSPDGAPIPGPFSCHARTLRLPRQTDNSLELVLDTPRGSCRIPIGLYIAASGYDWTAEDLEDISLQIDVAVSSLELNVNGWRRTLSFDILI